MYIRALFTQAEGADDVLSFPPIIGERYTRRYAPETLGGGGGERGDPAFSSIAGQTSQLGAPMPLCTRGVTWEDVIPTTTSFSVSTFRLL